MADKEKRIAIYETESKVIEGNYGDFYNTLLRSEAVERIAKAIYFTSCGTMKNYAKGKKEYIPFAEAALNALLEP